MNFTNLPQATNSHLVVGSSDGLVNIREHPTPKAQPVKRLASAITPGTPGYFARGKNFKPSSVSWPIFEAAVHFNEFVVVHQEWMKFLMKWRINFTVFLKC